MKYLILILALGFVGCRGNDEFKYLQQSNKIKVFQLQILQYRMDENLKWAKWYDSAHQQNK